MFISEIQIKKLEDLYGVPELKAFRIPTTPEEFDRIKSSQKHGREHDVTLYIIKDGSIVVIAKHFYPPGLYRAPSGGIHPGEDFIEGAKREAWEETGCHIEFRKFLMKTDVEFVLDQEQIIKWHSYVFLADYLSGDFDFPDTHEIREVKLAQLPEFEYYSKIMRQTDIGGLHYRAALHDALKPLLPL